jgi:FKBP-type peptidyl-prolyl cis-trans isomerase
MKQLLFILLILGIYVSGLAQKKDTVTTKTGIKYIQIKEGNGKKPKDGQKVKILFRGTLPDGTVFESNMDVTPAKLVVGEDMIPGWTEGLKLMSEGEKAYLWIPSKLAYGKKGFKDPDNDKVYIIPPDTDLLFEIELVSVK